MAHLSLAAKPLNNFLQPRSFPLLHLPWWAAKSFTAEPDLKFLANVIYSPSMVTTTSACSITSWMTMAPSSQTSCRNSFLPYRISSVYQEYFEASHPFWEIFPLRVVLRQRRRYARNPSRLGGQSGSLSKVTVAKLASCQNSSGRSGSPPRCGAAATILGRIHAGVSAIFADGKTIYLTASRSAPRQNVVFPDRGKPPKRSRVNRGLGDL